MFGFFKGNSKMSSVLPADRKWIEQYFKWFVKVFGIDKLKEKPFFLLNHNDFPYTDLKNENQFQDLLVQLCNHLEIDINDIGFQFFDDFKSQQWSTYIPFDRYSFDRSIFTQTFDINEKRYQIKIAQSAFQNDAVFIAILMKELMHVKLVGGGLIKEDNKNLYAILELACVYFGMGIILANVVITSDKKWLSSNTWLSDKEISYANALVCYITGTDGKQYLPLLNNNTKSLFKQHYEYLIKTDDTPLNQKVIEESVQLYRLNMDIKTGFKQNKFEQVIEACKQLYERHNTKTTYVFTNWGYALLKQKKYKEAIGYFNRAIDIAPFGPFPYNNRGYCKLNLGDLENALVDIQSSIDLDAGNGFAWRNLGAYYLAIGEPEKALTHFETAINLNPDTELIHFYLSKAYALLNKPDLFKKHQQISIDKGEYNDSCFE